MRWLFYPAPRCINFILRSLYRFCLVLNQKTGCSALNGDGHSSLFYALSFPDLNSTAVIIRKLKPVYVLPSIPQSVSHL